jgi:hypothetical protein
MIDYLTPCMGGWCARRDICEHYYSDSDLAPVDNVCKLYECTMFLPIDQPRQSESKGYCDKDANEHAQEGID